MFLFTTALKACSCDPLPLAALPVVSTYASALSHGPLFTHAVEFRCCSRDPLLLAAMPVVSMYASALSHALLFIHAKEFCCFSLLLSLPVLYFVPPLPLLPISLYNSVLLSGFLLQVAFIAVLYCTWFFFFVAAAPVQALADIDAFAKSLMSTSCMPVHPPADSPGDGVLVSSCSYIHIFVFQAFVVKLLSVACVFTASGFGVRLRVRCCVRLRVE